MKIAGKRIRKAVLESDKCVACGCCRKVCPVKAIEIYKGIVAEVDADKCVGCGRCAEECPASLITLKEVVK